MAFNSGTAPVPTSYDCQNCGAKLPPPCAEGQQVCTYCQATYQVQREASSPQGFTIVFGSTASTFGNNVPSFGSYPAPSSQAIDAMVNAGVKTARWGAMIGLIITLVVIVAVAVPVYLAVKDGFGSFSTATGTNANIPGAPGINLNLTEEGGILLPGEPTAAPQVVQTSNYYDQTAKASKNIVVRLDLGGKKVAWQSKPLEESGGLRRPIVTDGTNVYVVDGAKIRAIKAADGTDVWSGPLADKISTSCGDCVFLSAGKLIARTDDGQVQALDTATGKPVWNRKVKDVRARPYVVGDKVLVLDGEKGVYTLTIVNSADGSDLGTIAPNCGRSNSIKTDSQVIPSPLENAVYLGFGSSPGCWQRFDLANPAAPTFNVEVKGAYLDYDESRGVVGEGKIVWGQSAAGGAIGMIDLSTGTGGLVAEEENMRFIAVGVSNGNAIMRAKNTRGTAKLSIRAVNLATGATAWEKSLGEAESLDLPERSASSILSDNETLVSITVTLDGKVQVASVGATKTEIVVKGETLDGASGVASGAATPITSPKATGISEASLIGWNGSRATLLAGTRVVSVDTANGALVGSVP